MPLRRLSREILQRAEAAFRRRWRRLNLRGVSQADAHRRLDLLYKIRDPWNMATDRERFRFVESSRILHERLVAPSPRAGSILEIGCGEGHQSEHLAPLCERLCGIDISPTAVARARQRVPSADLVAGDLLAQPWAGEVHRYDIVTAFEVLYYVKDIPRLLRAMSTLGRSCIVSYFVPSAEIVEPPLLAMPIEGRDGFRFEDTHWRIAWWRNPRPGP